MNATADTAHAADTAIAAFIFDLDGVITDTAEYHYLSWKQLADEEAIPFSRADNDHLRGRVRHESLQLLLKGRTLDAAEAQAWMARKNLYFHRYLKTMTAADLLPGVGEFLQTAHDQGLKLGLASASQNAVEVIGRLGIAPLLSAIGDGRTVVNQKPAPDLFVWVAGRLGVRPGQAVVFEDAEAGVTSARAAGMVAVGLGPQERLGHAHLVLPSLDQLTVGSLFKALSALGQR